MRVTSPSVWACSSSSGSADFEVVFDPDQCEPLRQSRCAESSVDAVNCWVQTARESCLRAISSTSRWICSGASVIESSGRCWSPPTAFCPRRKGKDSGAANQSARRWRNAPFGLWSAGASHMDLRGGGRSLQRGGLGSPAIRTSDRLSRTQAPHRPNEHVFCAGRNAQSPAGSPKGGRRTDRQAGGCPIAD